MYIGLAKDYYEEVIYVINSKTFAAMERAFLALDTADCINGVVLYGPGEDDPTDYAFRIIREGKIRKPTLVEWSDMYIEYQCLIKYGHKHGARKLEPIPCRKKHGKRKVQKHME